MHVDAIHIIFNVIFGRKVEKFSCPDRRTLCGAGGIDTQKKSADVLSRCLIKWLKLCHTDANTCGSSEEKRKQINIRSQTNVSRAVFSSPAHLSQPPHWTKQWVLLMHYLTLCSIIGMMFFLRLYGQRLRKLLWIVMSLWKRLRKGSQRRTEGYLDT